MCCKQSMKLREKSTFLNNLISRENSARHLKLCDSLPQRFLASEEVSALGPLPGTLYELPGPLYQLLEDHHQSGWGNEQAPYCLQMLTGASGEDKRNIEIQRLHTCPILSWFACVCLVQIEHSGVRVSQQCTWKPCSCFPHLSSACDRLKTCLKFTKQDNYLILHPSNQHLMIIRLLHKSNELPN